jgi:hypothetical protein
LHTLHIESSERSGSTKSGNDRHHFNYLSEKL